MAQVSDSAADRRLPGGRRDSRWLRGSAYLIALVTIVVALTLGLAVLAAASQAVRREQALRRTEVVRSAAIGGLEYGYWAFRFGSEKQPPDLPMNLTTTLGGCTVQVQVADNAQQVPMTIRVTSTASREGRSISLTRIYAAKEMTDVFIYALASDSSQNERDPMVCGSDPEGNGDVWVNGDVKWEDPASAVYGTVWATKNINDALFAWAKFPHQPTLQFPDLDLAYYQAAASVIYTSDTSLTDPTFDEPFTVVYVDGDLTIQGTVTGTGTIVAEGRIYVEGNLVYAQADRDKIALIAKDDIIINSEAQTVSAICFAKDKLSLQPRSTQLSVPVGALVAGSLDIRGGLQVVHDPDLNEEQMKQALQLPGHTL